MMAALPLAWKIGAPIGLAVALIGSYLAWQYHQRSIGREQERADIAEQLMQQQQEALGYFIVSEAQKLRAVERAGSEKDRAHARLRQSYQEVVAYEQREQTVELPMVARPACAVAPDLVRTVNGLARVLDDVSTQRDATSGGSATEPPRPPGGASAGSARGGDRSGSGQADPRADGQADHTHH